MITLRDLEPLWPEAPRHCLTREFPKYRFVPGLNPHPRGHPAGHAYEIPEEKVAYLPPEKWRDNDLYLFGVDLYHQGYLWESHEVWETLWHLTKKDDVEGQFLQGLIQNSAAQLKVHLRHWGGAKHLSEEAHRRFHFVQLSGKLDQDGCFMGLSVSRLMKDIERYYGPVWTGKSEEVSGQPPRIILELDNGYH